MAVSPLPFAVRLSSSFVHDADLEKELSTPCNPAKAITIFHIQHEIQRYYTGPAFFILPKTFRNIIGKVCRVNNQTEHVPFDTSSI